MDLALYGSIWVALALYAAGELGQSAQREHRTSAGWPWWISALGAAIAVVHVIIAMGARHGWSHASAIAATARQTRAIYGLDWGGGVFVNYAFVAVWIVELWRWRRAPEGNGSLPDAATWLVRAFFFVVIVNAAIVFAGGARWIAGALIAVSLVAAWRPRLKNRNVSARRDAN